VDIFEYAKQMEKDGENFYRRLADTSFNKGLNRIFTMLGDEEVKHYIAIDKMQTESLKMAETTILNDAKNIFMEIKNSEAKIEAVEKQIELYKKAQDIEKKSRDFYLEKSSQVKLQYQKELFLKLAEEEKKHYFLLDNIIEFLSRPETWLENAEFCHLEEY
jgi:rubrerythrin